MTEKEWAMEWTQLKMEKRNKLNIFPNKAANFVASYFHKQCPFKYDANMSQKRSQTKS